MTASFIGPHPLTPATLLQAMRHGLSPPARAALLRALHGATSHQQLRRTAYHIPLLRADREAARTRLDPFALALWRVVAHSQPSPFFEAPTSGLEGLRPTHRQVVEAVGRAPLAFAQLVVEEARNAAVVERREEVRWTRRAVAMIGGSALHDLATPAQLGGLRLRARAYLADAFRMAGRHIEAEKVLQRVSDGLAKGTGDPELTATVHEIAADLLRVQGRPMAAVERLEAGLALLTRTADWPRRAELLIASGNALIEAGRPRRAATPLIEALSLLPDDAFPRLRLSTLHNLAAAAHWAGDPHTARAHLAAAAHLYGPWGDALIEAQRLRLLGSVFLDSGRLDRAERLLRAARSRFLALGHGTEAVRILLELGRLYIRQGRLRELARLEGLLQGLITRPEPRRLVLAELRALRQAAAENGIELHHLTSTIEALEERSTPPSVS